MAGVPPPRLRSTLRASRARPESTSDAFVAARAKSLESEVSADVERLASRVRPYVRKVGTSRVEPVWIEFGIGKAAEAETRLTGMAGTPAFSAPESRRGERTALSDVYSFGAVLDEELGTRDPRIEALIADERTLLERHVRQCNNEDATKRPASAGNVADVLSKLARGELVEAEKTKRASDRSRSVRDGVLLLPNMSAVMVEAVEQHLAARLVAVNA